MSKNNVPGAKAAADQLGNFDDNLDARVDKVVQRCDLINMDFILLPTLVELLKRHRVDDCSDWHNCLSDLFNKFIPLLLTNK